MGKDLRLYDWYARYGLGYDLVMAKMFTFLFCSDMMIPASHCIALHGVGVGFTPLKEFYLSINQSSALSKAYKYLKVWTSVHSLRPPRRRSPHILQP